MNLLVELAPLDGSPQTCSYRAVEKIGSGSFGDILAAVNEADPEDWVALKVEARYRAADCQRKRAEHSMVRFEHLVCKELMKAGPRGCPCPAIRGCVSVSGEHDVLAMELLGPNLHDYAVNGLRAWPVPPDLVLVLGAVLVGRLEQMHRLGFVHRDVKPENLAIRLHEGQDEGPIPSFVITDYALSARFMQGDQHIQARGDAEVAGTHRYMAIHVQRGTQQTRRSDLEGLAHVLVFLARGNLPWQNLEAERAEMLRCKENTSVEELCRDLCPAFPRFLAACRRLGFDEKPDYQALQRGLLQDAVGRPCDFQAVAVRHHFRDRLRRWYFGCRTPSPCPAPRASWPQKTLHSSVWLFARRRPGDSDDEPRGATELAVHAPRRASDLNDLGCFFFEAFTEALPGTIQVVVGPRRFFGFLKEEYLRQAHADRGLELGGEPTQLVVFSLRHRDLVIWRSQLGGYDLASGKPYESQWNLRGAFWGCVVLPGSAQWPPHPAPADSAVAD